MKGFSLNLSSLKQTVKFPLMETNAIIKCFLNNLTKKPDFLSLQCLKENQLQSLLGMNLIHLTFVKCPFANVKKPLYPTQWNQWS